jgi:hypothetical protein
MWPHMSSWSSDRKSRPRQRRRHPAVTPDLIPLIQTVKAFPICAYLIPEPPLCFPPPLSLDLAARPAKFLTGGPQFCRRSRTIPSPTRYRAAYFWSPSDHLVSAHLPNLNRDVPLLQTVEDELYWISPSTARSSGEKSPSRSTSSSSSASPP